MLFTICKYQHKSQRYLSLKNLQIMQMTDYVIHSCQPNNLNIIHQVCIQSYLGQLAAQTWQANSSKGNTPAAIKNSVSMQLTLFQSPLTLFQYVSVFQLRKHEMTPQTQANIFICLLDHALTSYHQPSKCNAKGGQKCLQDIGRSGTQHVANKTVKLVLWSHLQECFGKNQTFLIQIG